MRTAAGAGEAGKKRLLKGIDLRLFTAGERVACALSGGADSVAQLLALMDANGAKQSLGVVLSAVHVHHGLRGAEADEEEAFVRALCARWEVPLLVERVDTPARQQAEREGVEEAARELRYAIFEQLLATRAADVVATAHTLDDQAETVVMKLLRGAWTEGLGGISPVLPAGGAETRRAVRPLGTDAADRTGTVAGNRIVRPMLRVRRTEVEAFLRERGQLWREDSSNRDLRLTRNRVRHELMPVLRTFNPSVDEQLARTAVIARDEESFWGAEVARVLPSLLLPGKPVRGGGRAVSTAAGERSYAIELERLSHQSPALRRRILRAAVAALGVRLGAEDTGRLLELAGFGGGVGEAQSSGGRLELSGGLRAERSLRELRLHRRAD